MANAVNPIMNMYQTQLEASRRFADAVFSGTEKIDRMMLEATHRAFTEQMNFAQAVAAARDPRGAANLQTAFLSHRPDNVAGYQKEIMHIFSDMQNEIGKSMQYYAEQLMPDSVSNAQAPLKMTQASSGSPTLNPITGLLSVWESAFREVASMANRNMAAARTNFENAANAVSTLNRSQEAARADAVRQTSGRRVTAGNGAEHAIRINGASRSTSTAARRNIHTRKSPAERKSHSSGKQK